MGNVIWVILSMVSRKISTLYYVVCVIIRFFSSVRGHVFSSGKEQIISLKVQQIIFSFLFFFIAIVFIIKASPWRGGFRWLNSPEIHYGQVSPLKISFLWTVPCTTVLWRVHWCWMGQEKVGACSNPYFSCVLFVKWFFMFFLSSSGAQIFLR